MRGGLNAKKGLCLLTYYYCDGQGKVKQKNAKRHTIRLKAFFSRMSKASIYITLRSVDLADMRI